MPGWIRSLFLFLLLIQVIVSADDTTINWLKGQPPKIEVVGNGKIKLTGAIDYPDVQPDEKVTLRCFGSQFIGLLNPIPIALGFIYWDSDYFYSEQDVYYVSEGVPAYKIEFNIASEDITNFQFNIYMTPTQPPSLVPTFEPTLAPVAHGHTQTPTPSPTYDRTQYGDNPDLYAFYCGAFVTTKNSAQVVKKIIPQFTAPSVIYSRLTDDIEDTACYQDMKILQDTSKWGTDPDLYMYWDGMTKATGRIGASVSMGDHGSCYSLEVKGRKSNYCLAKTFGMLWCGFCLPDTCNNSNIVETFTVSSALSIAETSDASVQLLQFQNPELMASLDEQIAEATNSNASDIATWLNPLITGLGYGSFATATNQLSQAVTLWSFTQPGISDWWCGPTSKYSSYIWGFVAPTMIVIFIVIGSSVYDTGRIYSTHMENKRSIQQTLYTQSLIEEEAKDGVQIEGSNETPQDEIKAQPPLTQSDIVQAHQDLSDFWQPTELWEHIIVAFSIERNWQKFMSTRGGKLAFFDGIRVYSAWWVILGHTEIYVLFTVGFANMYNIYPSNSKADSTSFWWQIIPGAFFAVDTFFFLGGFFAAFIMIRMAFKMQPARFFAGIPFLYLDRWLRLTPCVLFAALGWAFVLPNIGEGPLWPYKRVDHLCNKSGAFWAELFYITSWPQGGSELKADWSACLGVTWYLTCDFFYFAISPFCVAAYCYINPKAGGLSAIICMLGFTIKYAQLSEKYHLKASLFAQTDIGWDETYGNPTCRGAPYFWGVFLGMMYDYIENKRSVYFKNNEFKINGLQSIILQCTGLFIIFWCVFLPYFEVKDAQCTPADPSCDWEDPWPQSAHTAYSILARPLFVMGLSCYCVSWIWGPDTSYTRPFLTFAFLPQLGKLSFLMYLWHAFFLTWFYGQQTTPVNYTRLNMLIFWLGIGICAMFTAVFWHLMIEAPSTYFMQFVPWKPKKKKKAFPKVLNN